MLLYLAYFLIFCSIKAKEHFELGQSDYIKTDKNKIDIEINLKFFERKFLYILINDKRSTGYFSSDHDPNIYNSLYKSPLFGTNIIIVPSSAILNKQKGYLHVDCEEKCNFELTTTAYDMIPLNEGNQISFQGLNEIAFRVEKGLDRVNYQNMITVFSSRKDDFSANIIFYNGTVNEYKFISSSEFFKSYIYWSSTFGECPSNDCYFKVTIALKYLYSYVTLSYERRNFVFLSGVVSLGAPNYGLLVNSYAKCFDLQDLENAKYTLEFFIENEDYSLDVNLQKDSNERFIIYRTKSLSFIKDNSFKSFCLTRENFSEENFKGNIYTPYYFVLYSNTELLKSQSMISLHFIGYEALRKVEKGTVRYFRQNFFPILVNFYIKVKKGRASVSTARCDEFPFCQFEYKEKSKLVQPNNILKINNEFFGILAATMTSASCFSSEQNLIKIQCDDDDDEEDGCEILILLYNQGEEIKIYPKEKISLISSIRNALKINIQFNITDNFLSSIFFNTYSHFIQTRTSVESQLTSKKVYTEDYGISQQIQIVNDSENPDFNSLKGFYNMFVSSSNPDYISFSLFYTKKTDMIISYLWQNEDIYLPLTPTKNQTIIYLENVPKKEIMITLLDVHGCKIDADFPDINRTYTSIENDLIFNHLFTKRKYIAKISLEKAYEPVCNVHFTSYNVKKNEEGYVENVDTILLKENSRHRNYLANPNKDTSSLFEYFLNKVNYEYLTFKSVSYLVIDVMFEDNGRIDIEYGFYSEESKREQIKKETLFYPRKIVVEPIDLTVNCLSKENACIMYISLSFNTDSEYSGNISLLEYSISVKVNEIHPVYLESNNMRTDMIFNNNIQYYFNYINAGDYGEVVLNNKKGSGVLFGRLIESRQKDKNPNWLGRIRLTTKPNYEASDRIVFDINTGQAIIGYEKTQIKCSFKDPCILLIGVVSNDDANSYKEIEGLFKREQRSIYEYSIYFSKRTQNDRLPSVKFHSNEYVTKSLFGDYMVYYKYRIPNGATKIYYEMQCEKCELFTKIKSVAVEDDDDAETGYFNNKFTNKTGFINIDTYFPLEKKPYLRLGIKSKKIEDMYSTTFLFKLSPFYDRAKNNYLMITSEHYSLCNSNIFPSCIYLIPAYLYDHLSEIFLSVSTEDDKPVNDCDLDAILFNQSDFDYITDTKSKGANSILMISKMKGAQTNYLDITSSSFSSINTILFVSIIPHSKGIYNVFFTSVKYSYITLLAPNKKNLLYLRPKEEKKVSLPYIDTSFYQNSTIVKVKQIKGSARLNINEKSYIIDKTHNIMNIMFSGVNSIANKENRNINITGATGMFFYMSFDMKEKENLHKATFGKTNYYIYQLETFPIMLYSYLEEDLSDDIEINFSIDGLDIIQDKKAIKFRVFLLSQEFIQKRLKSSKIAPNPKCIYRPKFDTVLNQGSIRISHEDIKEFSTRKGKAILVRFELDKYSNKTEEIMKRNFKTNSIVKLTIMPVKTEVFSLPQYDYFYGTLSMSSTNVPYNVYKLEIPNNHRFLYLEFADCEGKSDFSIRTSQYISDTKLIYKSEAAIPVINKEEKFGKRTVLYKPEDYITSVYLFVFSLDKKASRFAMKYYTYEYGNYVERPISPYNFYEIKDNDTKVSFSYDKKRRGYHFKWNEIALNATANSSSVKYYMRMYKKLKNKDVNSICILDQQANYGFQSQSNEIFIDEDDINESVYVNLVGSFKNLNQINENLVAYKGFLFKPRMKTSVFILICLIFSIFMIFVALYLYKILRKFQLKHGGYKFIEEINTNNRTIEKNKEENFI